MSETLAVQQLFVYGTLMSHFDNPMAFILDRNCQLVSQGSFPGTLYHIQEDFPGAIHDENASTLVHGQLFTIGPESFQQVMRLLDQYEGFHADDEQSSLFTRTVININADGHQVPCWVYLFNQPVDSYPTIPSGDFWEFLKENNLHKKH